MPVVPKAPIGQVALRQPGGQQSIQANPDAFGAGLAKGLGEAGDVLHQRAAQIKDEVDTARLTEAMAATNDQVRYLLNDKTNGILNREGRHAASGMEDANAGFDDLQRQMVDSLDNDTQKAAFKRFFAGRRSSALDNVSKHMAVQHQKFRSDATAAMLTSTMESAVANYANPQEVADQIKFGVATVRANYLGKPAEVIEKVEAEFKTSIHAGVIEQLLVDDENAASAYFSANRDQINGTTQTKIREVFARRKAQRKAEYRAYLAQVKDQVKSATYVLDRGFTPDNLTDIKRAAKGTKYASDLNEAIALQSTARQFAQLPPSQRAQYLELSRADKTKSELEVRALTRLETIGKDLDKQLADDPISYAVDTGLVESLPPLTGGDEAAMSEALRARRTAALALADHLGVPEMPALTNADSLVIDRALAKGSATQRAATLGRIAEGLGDLAPVTFRQLGDARLGVAGERVAMGDPATAETLLKGLDIAKENPKIIPGPADWTPNMAPAFEVFAGQPSTAKRYSDAAKAIYASLAQAEGVFDGVIDESLAERALNQATGGFIELDRSGWFNGDYRIQAPRPGRDASDIEDWFDRISPEDISTAGGINAMDADTFLEQLRDGEAELQTLTPGRYLVKIGGKYLLTGDQTRRFVLEFSE